MSPPETIVVKVGGSLFQWSGLPAALNRWIAAEAPKRIVLIAGGGPFAELIRSADRQFELGEEPSHEICVELLAGTARLLAAILPTAARTDQWDELNGELTNQRLIVFDPVRFLQTIEPKHRDPLPRNWTATTDSIAARIADLMSADELVLLKSASAPANHDFEQLAKSGYVDEAFPHFGAKPPGVRFVNLRDA